MTSLVTPAVVKTLVKTSLNDTVLQAVIDRVEAEITGRIGAPWTGDAAPSQIVKTLRGEGCNLFLPTEIYEVVSVVEDGSTLTSSEYQIWGGGVIERLPSDSTWGDRVVVTYKPTDDRLLRTQVIIEVVRLDIERTAMTHESVAGEYAYDAPDWNLERRKQFRRLEFKAV